MSHQNQRSCEPALLFPVRNKVSVLKSMHRLPANNHNPIQFNRMTKPALNYPCFNPILELLCPSRAMFRPALAFSLLTMPQFNLVLLGRASPSVYTHDVHLLYSHKVKGLDLLSPRFNRSGFTLTKGQSHLHPKQGSNY